MKIVKAEDIQREFSMKAETNAVSSSLHTILLYFGYNMLTNLIIIKMYIKYLLYRNKIMYVTSVIYFLHCIMVTSMVNGSVVKTRPVM